jgi:hypothetical protein
MQNESQHGVGPAERHPHGGRDETGFNRPCPGSLT